MRTVRQVGCGRARTCRPPLAAQCARTVCADYVSVSFRYRGLEPVEDVLVGARWRAQDRARASGQVAGDRHRRDRCSGAGHLRRLRHRPEPAAPVASLSIGLVSQASCSTRSRSSARRAPRSPWHGSAAWPRHTSSTGAGAKTSPQPGTSATATRSSPVTGAAAPERSISSCGAVALVVICEVKARRSTAFGPAAGAVGPVKQQRLRRLAAAWLAASGVRGVEVRFDVVAINGRTLEVIPNAF